jgi:hypothetical protein
MTVPWSKMTPRARAEIAEFSAHLRDHPKDARQPETCEFCRQVEAARLRRERESNDPTPGAA